MRIPDPLAPLEGGFLHKLDIRVAEFLTGVRRRTISHHVTTPLVRRGFRRRDALALFHWVLVIGGVGLAVGAMKSIARAPRRA